MRFLICFLSLALSASYVTATPSDEIESLLHYVAELDGASFVRNGDAHTPKEAEAHLRLKWTKQKGQITTAEDFIRLCGSKSSISGKSYLIRFKDGHEEEAAVVLLTQLATIRRASSPRIQGTPNKAPEPTRGTGAILFFLSRWPRVAQL
jgi:hypothetical protein